MTEWIGIALIFMFTCALIPWCSHLYRKGHRWHGRYVTDIHKCTRPRGERTWELQQGTVWECRRCKQRWVLGQDSYGTAWKREKKAIKIKELEKELGIDDA